MREVSALGSKKSSNTSLMCLEAPSQENFIVQDMEKPDDGGMSLCYNYPSHPLPLLRKVSNPHASSLLLVPRSDPPQLVPITEEWWCIWRDQPISSSQLLSWWFVPRIAFVEDELKFKLHDLLLLGQRKPSCLHQFGMGLLFNIDRAWI